MVAAAPHSLSHDRRGGGAGCGDGGAGCSRTSPGAAAGIRCRGLRPARRRRIWWSRAASSGRRRPKHMPCATWHWGSASRTSASSSRTWPAIPSRTPSTSGASSASAVGGVVVVVTDAFHLPRALYVFRRLGLTVDGEGVPRSEGVTRLAWARSHLDERLRLARTAALFLTGAHKSIVRRVWEGGEATMPDEDAANPADPPAALPLSGVRVLDIATFLAAPYAAAIFSEFGAEVIKIEEPVAGDPFRRFGTATARADSTFAWLSEARNKRSVTLDLRTAEGAALFKRLVAIADVVCENFRPGTLEKWGLGWETLSAINPKLILLRVSGYGQTGPYRDRPGFARIAHAVGGLANLAGMPDGPPVTPGSTSLGDYLAGLYGAIGALIALLHARAGGGGQVIDVGLYEAVFRVLDELAPAYAAPGSSASARGSARATPARTATSPPGTAPGSPSPVPPTRCSPGWPRRWGARTLPPNPLRDAGAQAGGARDGRPAGRRLDRLARPR